MENLYEDDNESIEFVSEFEGDDDETNDLILEDNFGKNNRKRKSINSKNDNNKKLIKLDNESKMSKKLETKSIQTNSTNEINEERQLLKFKIDALCEYTHVLMHCILYKINYYNKKTHFDKVLKYNIIVYKCKSEIVCEYIMNCIESMRIVLYKTYNLDETSSSTSSSSSSILKHENDSQQKIFSIGLAVLKSYTDDQPTNNVNLLIKRYTLQIENLLADLNYSSSDDEQQTHSCEQLSSLDEWNFRDSILKCLYSKDIIYPGNFKWQIQMRTRFSTINQLGEKEDLFKLFAWRQCDQEELTSITTKYKPTATLNRISIKPVKTMTHFNKLRAQLFIEQPTLVQNTSPFKSKYKKYSKQNNNFSP